MPDPALLTHHDRSKTMIAPKYKRQFTNALRFKSQESDSDLPNKNVRSRSKPKRKFISPGKKPLEELHNIEGQIFAPYNNKQYSPKKGKYKFVPNSDIFGELTNDMI